MKYPNCLKNLTCLERCLLLGLLATVFAHFDLLAGAVILVGFVLGLFVMCSYKMMR